MRKVFETNIGGMPIVLEQTSKERFQVTYWKQVKSRLNYSEAATELGACIMHAASCEGRMQS